MPVAGRGGVSSALIVDERVFVVDCGRGTPSAFINAGLDFGHLEAVFITHLHADHVGDLPGMLLYPWGIRTSPRGPLPPIQVYGPCAPRSLPGGDGEFHRETTIHPDRPCPGTKDLVESILVAFCYHLNVMPLDAHMPDAGQLVRGVDVMVEGPVEPAVTRPVVVTDDGRVRVTAVAVSHGHAVPSLAYRFDTPDGSVVFSGDTTVNDNVVTLAKGADILVHCVADLGYLGRHGMTGAELERMAGLHTDVSDVGGVAELAGPGELILTHYLPADPEAISNEEWRVSASKNFTGRTTAGHDGLRRVVGS
jgi:ribonuclease BN (tRNA processing enzyme)